MSKELREIRIVADVRGDKDIKRIANSLGEMNKSLKTSSGVITTFSRAWAGLMGAQVFGMGISQITDMADSFLMLKNRINALTNGTADAEAVIQRLADVSKNTKSSLEDTSDVYAKLLSSTQQYGLSVEDIADLTEMLQNSFRIVGVSGEGATSVIQQFSQAMSKGRYDGDELKSMIENNAYVTGILREAFKSTGKSLTELGEKRMLPAAKVLEILFKNMKKTNELAQGMQQTIGQTLTVAFNDFTLAVGRLFDKLKIQKGFQALVEVLSEKLPLALTLLAVASIPKVIAALDALALGIRALAVAAWEFTLSNPLTAFFATLSLAILVIYDNLDDFKRGLETSINSVGNWLAKMGDFLNLLGVISETDWVSSFGKGVQSAGESLKGFRFEYEKTGKIIEDSNPKIKASGTLLQNTATAAERFRSVLALLNKQWLANKDSEAYWATIQSIKINNVTDEFKQGRIDLMQYNQELSKLSEELITRNFNQGAINIKEFNDQISAEKMKQLNAQVEAGSINALDYAASIAEVSTEQGKWLLTTQNLEGGIADFLRTTKTESQQVADVTRNAFESLTTHIVGLIKNGNFELNKFFENILDQLLAIIVRMRIVIPLAQAMMSMLGGTPAAAAPMAGQSYLNTSVVAANGASFGGGSIARFANGGVVNMPTLFGYNKSKMGLMGEAGPEAIMPLQRGPDGKLGVQATTAPVIININNQAGAEITQNETTGPNGEKMIEMLITNKVRDGIANGTFDRTFQAAYGIKRQGY